HHKPAAINTWMPAGVYGPFTASLRRRSAVASSRCSSFADYWRSVDYVLSYFGSHWDQKGETGAYNAVYAMINACAYSFSKSPVHLREFEKWMSTATWPKTTAIASLRSKALEQKEKTGNAAAVPYSAAYSLAK